MMATCSSLSGVVSRRPRRMPRLRLGLAAMLAVAVGCTADTPVAAEPSPPGATVRMTIDYGDGVVKQFTALRWKEGTTVGEALREAARHPRGITFGQQGAGEQALLSSIDGLENEGGKRDAKNWIYYVNEQRGDRSFEVKQLSANDAVLWKFERYE
jgi:hypothetical protein